MSWAWWWTMSSDSGCKSLDNWLITLYSPRCREYMQPKNVRNHLRQHCHLEVNQQSQWGSLSASPTHCLTWMTQGRRLLGCTHQLWETHLSQWFTSLVSSIWSCSFVYAPMLLPEMNSFFMWASFLPVWSKLRLHSHSLCLMTSYWTIWSAKPLCSNTIQSCNM